MVTTADPPAAAKAGGGGVARTLAQHHQALVGFLLGALLVLVLYTAASGELGSTNTIVVLQSTATGEKNSTASHQVSAPNNSTQAVDSSKGQKKKKSSEEEGDEGVNSASNKMEEDIIQQDIHGTINKGAPRKPICDLSDPRFDICDISGDARAIGANRTVLYVPPAGGGGGRGGGEVWSIRDQSRKHLEYVGNVTVRSLNASQSRAAPACTSRHSVPAVVFAMNGLTSNPWHDFSDVLIPLFITARAMDGEVQLLVSDLQPWFVRKYSLILRNLSRHDLVDFNGDGGVRCYPRVVVGLRSHRDLGIDPARAPRHYTMLDFRLYLRSIYSLPPADVPIPYKQLAAGAAPPPPAPRLMLINRDRNRRFMNVQEVAAAVRAAGFEVVLVEPRRDESVEAFSRAVDSCDVLMGAHGAGLTNFFFLRGGAVMLQVVPWGHMEAPSTRFYGAPAGEMGLRDVEYSIAAGESTLYEKYGKEHPAVRDPEAIHRQGWQLGMKYYWLEQDIRLNVTRFLPLLRHVLQLLRE